MTRYSFHPFTSDHLDAAHGLSQAASWPHRRDDWQMLLGLSSGVVALRDGVVVGTALRTDFGPQVSTTNMIIVAESERGQGLGRALMVALMPEAEDREYRLVATEIGVPLYEKMGFEARGRIVQYQGVALAAGAPGMAVETAGPGDMAAIRAMEDAEFAADRGALLDWLAENAELAVTRDAAGAVVGYAALRAFGRGLVIGPICAPDLATAQALVAHFVRPRAGQFIRLDTDADSGLGPLLESLGLAVAGGGLVMRRGERTAPAPRFALCSQAIG